MKIHCLIEKYKKNKKSILEWTKREGLDKNTHPKFAIGQIIEFWAGYNGDIRMRAEIVGIGKKEEIYLCWDAYWAHINDDKDRKISIAQSEDEKLDDLNKRVLGTISEAEAVLKDAKEKYKRFNIAKYFDTYFDGNVAVNLTREQADKEIKKYTNSKLMKYEIREVF